MILSLVRTEGPQSRAIEAFIRDLSDLAPRIATVKGDIVYLIGMLGDPEWVPRLERLVEGAIAPDLEDAARDALEALSARSGSRVRP